MEILLKKIDKIIKSNQGIGLIETVLAVLFSIVLIIALVTLTNFNIRNSTLADENQKAINSANSLVESLRSLKDISFTAFITESVANCATTDCTVTGMTSGDTVAPITVNLNTNSPVSYFRVVKVSDDEVKVNITTLWKVGSKTFSSPLSTTFTNWRSRN
jgi:Tfp pilus assembly protein PilV